MSSHMATVKNTTHRQTCNLTKQIHTNSQQHLYKQISLTEYVQFGRLGKTKKWTRQNKSHT